MNTVMPHFPQGEVKPTDLELRYAYHDGEPVKGAPFKAALPDGSVRMGTLDAEGYARLPDVPTGSAEITIDPDPRPFEKFKSPVEANDEMNAWFKDV